MERIILHVDVNNAFLSWTAVDMLQKGNPDIRKQYAVIGGDEALRKGIVLAKSPLAKTKGIATGDSLYEARKKCPGLKVYPPDFKIYQEKSNQMMKYLSQYSPLIEKYSIDECFIDYTGCENLFGNREEIAYKMKNEIKEKFGFTVNVGIGENKLCAKMASDFEKPDKVHTLYKNEIETKLWPLPVSELFMIGRASSKKLINLNIKTVYDLAHTPINILRKHFKSSADYMYEYANGIDNSKVEPKRNDPKSISVSRVLPYDYENIEDISYALKKIASEVGLRLRKQNLYAHVIQISIKYSDFRKNSRQEKTINTICTDSDIYQKSFELFEKIWNTFPIRTLTISLSELVKNNEKQLSIFDTNKNNNDVKLQKVLDNINDKYHDLKITYADILKRK